MQGNLCLSRQRHLDFPIESSSIIMGKNAAFSWVVTLVVIAVISIIAVIAIPNLSVFLEAKRTGKIQKDAMALATLSLAARSSGYPGWNTRSAAIRDLIDGVSVTNPAATNIVIRFQAKRMTAEEQAAVAAYLMSDGTNLIYVPAGGQPTN
jgi:type II secretory pathway pseudopilin PulG